MPLLLKTIVPFYSLHFVGSYNRITVEVTDFSTRGGLEKVGATWQARQASDDHVFLVFLGLEGEDRWY